MNDPRRGDEERYQVSKGRKSRGAREINGHRLKILGELGGWKSK